MPGASADFDWLRDHANEYRGQWVALAHGNLVGSSPHLSLLLPASTAVTLIHWIAPLDATNS